MKHWTFILSLPALLFAQLAFGQVLEDDESFVSYDQIVKELSIPETRARHRISADPFQNVTIHGGVSFISSHISIEGQDIGSLSGFHRGFEASMGIDLFSPHWTAEGAIRNFSAHKLDDSEIQLKEFDLRIIYKGYVTNRIRYRIGGGMASRYLDVKYLPGSDQEIVTSADATPVTKEFTTPSSIFSLGLEGYISKAFSLGAEIGYRSTLIDETVDKSAFDVIVKLDAHF